MYLYYKYSYLKEKIMDNHLNQKYQYYLNESNRLSEQLKNEKEYSKILENVLKNFMTEEELSEIARPETIKNPQQYAKRIGQIAAIAANRTVTQRSGAVEAKKALQSKGVGTDDDTFAAFSGSRSGGVRDTELYGDSSEAEAARQNLGIKTVLQPRSDAATREKAEAERKRLKDSRKGTPVLMGGKKVAIKRDGQIQ